MASQNEFCSELSSVNGLSQNGNIVHVAILTAISIGLKASISPKSVKTYALMCTTNSSWGGGPRRPRQGEGEEAGRTGGPGPTRGKEEKGKNRR